MRNQDQLYPFELPWNGSFSIESYSIVSSNSPRKETLPPGKSFPSPQVQQFPKQLDKWKEPNNQRMQVQAKKAFINYSFFVHKRLSKSRQALHETFFNLNTSGQRWLNLVFQNQELLFLLPPLFKEYFNPLVRFHKMINKVSIYNSCPSGLILRVHPLKL